jgi:hypothetical protein
VAFETNRRQEGGAIVIGRDFVLAGKVTLTLDTGDDYYTFHVASSQYEGRTYYLVFQETRKGRYIGTLNPRTGTLTLTAKSWLTDDDVEYIVLAQLFKRLWSGRALPKEWTVRHEGICGACGRKLTTPESLARGVGPECWGRANKRHIERDGHLHIEERPQRTHWTERAPRGERV